MLFEAFPPNLHWINFSFQSGSIHHSMQLLFLQLQKQLHQFQSSIKDLSICKLEPILSPKSDNKLISRSFIVGKWANIEPHRSLPF